MAGPIATNTDAAVVGAGPTGLLLAAELARRDVSCLLVDELDAPRAWDRATVVHPRSMEIFESLGLADQFLAVGVKTRGARLRSDGDVLGVLNIELAHSRYGFDLGISEEITERVLTGYLEQQGGSVTRGARMVGLRPGADGVALTLEHGGEAHEVAASWVVGCDGLHSTVRESVGIEFEGTDIPEPWAVFDATIDGWDDDFDMAASYLDTPPVILTPLPERRWRVYLRPTSDAADLVADATGLLQRYTPQATFTDIENPVRFHCHSRVAAAFRSGRVLLAGDAAHACTPAEGHGMNTGIQDAFNLSWKLALVCKGVSGEGLLDSYEAERRPVAIRIVESGAAAEAVQTLTDAQERAARDREFRRVLGDPESAHHEAAAAAEVDRSYADSHVVTGDAAGHPAPGQRLPDGIPAERAGGEDCTLCELTHHAGHTLFVLGGPEASGSEVSELVGALEARVGGSPMVDAVLGMAIAAGGPRLGRIDEVVAAQLGIDAIIILAVRPDRYVGFRANGADAGALQAYLDGLAG